MVYKYAGNLTGDCTDDRDDREYHEYSTGHPVHDADRHPPNQELPRTDGNHGDADQRGPRPERNSEGLTLPGDQARSRDLAGVSPFRGEQHAERGQHDSPGRRGDPSGNGLLGLVGFWRAEGLPEEQERADCEQHRDCRFNAPFRQQIQQAPGNRGNRALNGKRRSYSDEHRPMAIPGSQHEGCHEGLIRQFHEEDDAERKSECGEDVDRSTLASHFGTVPAGRYA